MMCNVVQYTQINKHSQFCVALFMSSLLLLHGHYVPSLRWDKQIVCHLWLSLIDLLEDNWKLDSPERTCSLQTRGTTQTFMGRHASIIECLLGASLKPTWVSWRAWGMPNISPWLAKSTLACIWSLSEWNAQWGKEALGKDPQEVAGSLFESSYLHTHWLIHIHVPVCTQTVTLSSKDITR